MDQNQIKRQTAYYCLAKDVLDGEYVRRDGWEPNFVASSIGMLSRVRLAGIVVDKVSSSQFVIDDGSANIQINFFDMERLPDFNVGDPVVVIGRPRESGDQRYVVVEIGKKLSSPLAIKDFISQRDKLLSFIPSVPHNLQQKAVVSEESFVAQKVVVPVEKIVESAESTFDLSEKTIIDTPPSTNSSKALIDSIRQLDRGDGASVVDVLAQVGPQGEKLLQNLINEGEVFELRAGKVKVLE